MPSDTILLEYDGPVAIVSNNRPEKHNAANDEMDARLWEILAELHRREGLRAVVWRGNGASFSSGRDTTELGVRKEDLSDLEFIERGHRGTQQFFTLPAPIVAALKGWVIGGSFERALLCDLRIAGESVEAAAARDPARRGARFRRHRAPVPDGRPRAGGRSRADRPRDDGGGGAPTWGGVAGGPGREARRDRARDRARDRLAPGLLRADVPPDAGRASRTRWCSARSPRRRSRSRWCSSRPTTAR